MRGRGLFGAIASAAVSSTAVAQESAQGLPCPGTWTLSAGQTQTIMGPGAAGGEGPVRMNVLQCGEELVLRDFLTGIPDGQRDRSFRKSGGAYVHRTSAEGMPVTVQLDADGARRMSGQIVIQGGMFVKPLELEFTGGGQSVDIGCAEEEDEKPELDAAISADAALEATVSAMRAQGLQAPAGSDLRLEDYVESYLQRSSRTEGEPPVRRVRLRLGADGKILPRPEAISAGRLECAVEKHSLEPTRYFLIFKIYRTAAGYDAVAQVVDVETGVIKAQQEIIGEGKPTLGGAIDGVWDKLGYPVGPPSDGLAAG